MSFTAHAQEATGSIIGRVQNANNGQYLNNARVTVPGTNIVVFTDEYGDYRISGVPAGTATVQVNFSGLETQTVEVTVVGGDTTSRNFRLGAPGRASTADDDEIIQLDSFEVASSRETNASAIAVQEQRYSASLKNVVAADAFGDVTEGNIGEFMKYLPGVTVDYVAADVRTMSVRGFADNFTSVSVNGARVASASSGANSRAFEFEQVSINNIARIEISKAPTPSMPADSLGGAVNMVSKNAFERDRAELRYRLYFSANDENLNPFSKSPGPMGKSTFKVLPGFDIDYTLPINENFGIVFTALSSNQLNEQHRSQPAWNFAQAGATPSNPYLQQYQLQDGPKNTFRDSVSLKADWRIAPGQVLSASIQSNYYKSQFGNRNRTFNVGTTAAGTGGGSLVDLSWGPDSTIGASGRGSVSGNSSFRDKMGQTNAGVVNYRFTAGNWEIDAGLNASKSRTWYRDTGRGHFSAMNISMVGVSRVEYLDIIGQGPQRIRVLNADGGELDPWDLGNYNLTNVRGNPLNASDRYVGGDISAKYKFDLAFPLAVKSGISIRKQTRDTRRYDETWNFIGQGGSTNQNAAFALDTDYSGQDAHWGMGRPQWPNPYLMWDLFQSRPEYFTQTANQARDAERFRRQNSYLLKEQVDAYYAQVETKLLENRLNIVGGIRIEKTENFGRGLRTQGPGLTLAEVQANLIERGYETKRDYDDTYPSLHFTYNITDDLLLRLSYSKTLGRPDFSNILPLYRANETEDEGFDDGSGVLEPRTIVANNTGLKPWTADGYDLSLEYYFPKGGVASVGAFRKDVDDFWGDFSGEATTEMLNQLGIDNRFVGYHLRTKINTGDARISGVEFNYQQPLAQFGEWGRNLNVFANATKLDLKGSNQADFAKFIEESASWGVTWSPRPIVLSLKWNYRGRQRLANQTGGQYGSTNGFREYFAPRTFLDLNFEYQFNKRFTAFINGRNILDKEQILQRFNAVSPDYSRTYRVESFGVQWAIGLKGTF